MQKNSKIIIREVSESERDLIIQFILYNFKELYNNEINPALYYKIKNKKEYYGKQGDSTLLAAFSKDGKLMGTITVDRYDGRIPGLEGICDTRNTAEISRCYVDKVYRRKGVGAALFKQAERFCKEYGYNILYLHTHKFLAGAQDFWKSQGFFVRLDVGDVLLTVHMDKNLVNMV